MKKIFLILLMAIFGCHSNVLATTNTKLIGSPVKKSAHVSNIAHVSWKNLHDTALEKCLSTLRYLWWYEVLSLELYVIHRVQHVSKKVYGAGHQVHHYNYKATDIKVRHPKAKGTLESLDQYFFTGLFFILPLNAYLTGFDYKKLIMMGLSGLIKFYLHQEYHNAYSPLNTFPWFLWLRKKHALHHKFVGKNFFLVDPCWDWIFGSFK